VSMTRKIEQVVGITLVERRRRWSAEEKAAIAGQAWRPSAHPGKRHDKVRVAKRANPCYFDPKATSTLGRYRCTDESGIRRL
jgi:hypothetical protein